MRYYESIGEQEWIGIEERLEGAWMEGEEGRGTDGGKEGRKGDEVTHLIKSVQHHTCTWRRRRRKEKKRRKMKRRTRQEGKIEWGWRK